MGMMLLGGSKMARWKLKRFWAERGLIRVEDGKDNSYNVVSVKSMLHRVRAVNDMLGNPDGAIAEYSDVRLEHQRFVEEMLDICREAQEQGMPTDPTAVRDAALRSPTSVSFASSIRELPSSLEMPTL